MTTGSEFKPDTALSEILHSKPIKHFANFAPMLPVLFALKGLPYNLNQHFVFEPMFSTRATTNMTWLTGRQTSKSTSIASSGILMANSIPYYNILYVTPLYEMVRRLSSNYVADFINESPFKKFFVDANCTQNVMQRSFINRSVMHFSFAFLDCTRTRGINSDMNFYDEMQDLDPAFPPIINETTSGSRWGGRYVMTGTPKTLDCLAEQRWSSSSQAEWCIPCPHCKRWNIPALEHHLDAMIGPDIPKQRPSREFPAIACYKCGKPLQTRNGRWVHAYPDRRMTHVGYHVPQIVLPFHCENPDKWETLLGKRRGAGNMQINEFYNEVCGVSFDSGSKLVTVTDLKGTAVLPPRTEIDRIVHSMDSYTNRVLAVDWGGGGKDGVSWTTAAVIGWRADGRIDIPFGYRSLTPHDQTGEALALLRLFRDFRCQAFVHDFCGAGEIREAIMVNNGLPMESIVPVSYTRLGRSAMMRFVPDADTGLRGHYQLDKARSLVLTAQMIKHKKIRLFQYDYKGEDDAGLLHDFLSLVEDKASSRIGGDTYSIIHNSALGPDDFAQAVNIGLNYLFCAKGKWPTFREISKFENLPNPMATA